MVNKIIIALSMGLTAWALAQDFCNAAKHTGASKKVNGNEVSSFNGVGYELWYDRATSGSLTIYEDGSMACSFQNAGDYLCRAGLSFDSDKKYNELGGDMLAEFKLVKQNINGADYSYVGVYGWMEEVSKSPSKLVEYYVVDNWLTGWRPGDWVASHKMGDYTIDGAKYSVYWGEHTGPAIKTQGNTTFLQYFSIRENARDCGIINISAHMRQWEKLGMEMGKLYEAKVLGEAGSMSNGVSGTADFPHIKVYVKGEDVPSSSSVALSSSSVASSSSKMVPSSSSEKVAKSSSSVGGSSSSGTDAIPFTVQRFDKAGIYQVFDMQGNFLGKVELKSGLSLKQAVANKFARSSVYLVKRGAFAKTIAVER